MRSTNRYSGSPVNVYLNNFDGSRRSKLPKQAGEKDHGISAATQSYYLGVNWGHLQAVYPVRDAEQNLLDSKVVIDTNMACVTPAWKVIELLNIEFFESNRVGQKLMLAKEFQPHEFKVSSSLD